MTTVAHATLSPNNVPVTKTGGTNPTLQNSDITDNVGVGVAIAVPTTVNGSSVCTTGSVCSGYQAAGSYLTGNQTITLTGYITGSGATSIATSMPTVNSNVGSFTSANITVNAQGQVLAASSGSSISTPVSIANGGTNNATYTTGSIPYYNGTNLNQDNSNLFWDSSNHRLGLGTASPAQLLDVNGTTKSIKLISPSGNVTTTGIAFGTSGISSGTLNATSNGSIALGYAATSGGTITSSGAACLAGGQIGSDPQTANITCSGAGGLAWGNSGSGGGSPGVLTASNSGAIAMGDVFEGTLQATGVGSIVFGLANGGHSLQATGTAAVAIGQNVQANANNAMTLGNGVTNSTANTMMIGFSGASTVTVSSSNLTIPQQKATTGQRYACIDTSGNIVSSASACSGT